MKKSYKRNLSLADRKAAATGQVSFMAFFSPMIACTRQATF
ncbi:hypothetical protein ACFQZE_09160 [Paenibacillus sp. GCM10027627]